MSGKALLILVIGFTVIFLVAGYFWGSLATRSVDNHVSYYKNTVAHNIAVSGANIGLSEVQRDSNWVSTLTDKPFENGYMTVSLTALGPPVRTLTSRSYFMGDSGMVKVKLMRDQALFAKYAWFIPSVSTGSPNRPWITGDSIYGGFHTNQFLVVDGDPVFFGKVTTLKGIKDQAKKPNVSNPQFLGGYAEGSSVGWDAEMQFPDQSAAAQEGVALGGNSYFSDENLWLTFHENGNVTYRTGPKSDDSSKYSAPITRPLSELAPTGIIFVDKGDVYLSGTLNGQVTVVADGSSGAGSGNVYLVGDIIYETDPMIPNGAGGFMPNPDCDDVMGIMATNNIIIATSEASGGKANNIDNPDINIDAGIFCVKGGFEVQDLGKSPANVPMGSIYLQGSMTAGKEEIVAEFNGNNITAGYNRHVIFDSRFSVLPPLWFPYVTYYRVVSWLE